MFTPNLILLISGLLLISTGGVLIFIVEKNRFNRRGLGGLQHFSTFSRSLVVRFLEKLVLIIGRLFLLCGTLLILLYVFA